MAENAANDSPRIPRALQAVFLKSNQGLDVHVPPTDSSADKIYPLKNQHNVDAQMKRCLSEHSIALLKSKEEKKPVSPQAYLDVMLRMRGYSTKRYPTMGTAYYNKPTPLQVSSYHLYLIGLVRSNDIATFSQLLASGLSQNPCNTHGESLAHMASRLGRHEILQIQIDNGCPMQVADDYGRTPLHDACWAPRPEFATIHTILKNDTRLFHMMDVRGHVPLNYVRKEHWGEWVEFLDAHQDLYWPVRETEMDQGPPPLVLEPANSRALPNPPNALSLDTAQMIASGNSMTTTQDHMSALQNMDCDSEAFDSGDDDSDDGGSSSDDDDDDDDDDSSSCYSEDLEEDLEELISSISAYSPVRRPITSQATWNS